MHLDARLRRHSLSGDENDAQPDLRLRRSARKQISLGHTLVNLACTSQEVESADYIWWRIKKNIVARYEIQDQQSVCDTEIHTLRLGDIAVATNPFELDVDYGLRLKARSPAEQTFVVQTACDSLGYLPTEQGVSGGHYSAEIMSNIVGPEGGRRLVERTVESLKGMWSAGQ